MSKYVGSISVIDDQGNIAFERELGTDEIIGELIERINFFQKPPEPGEGVVVGPHNISRIVKETKKALETPPKKVRGGGRVKEGRTQEVGMREVRRDRAQREDMRKGKAGSRTGRASRGERRLEERPGKGTSQRGEVKRRGRNGDQLEPARRRLHPQAHDQRRRVRMI